MVAKKIARPLPRSLSKAEQALVNMAEAKNKIAAQQEVVKANQKVVQAYLETREGEKQTITVQHAGEVITGTLVAGSSLIYDEDALKKKVGATIWRKISSTVMDKTKLGEALKRGDVDDVTLASVATEKPITPYVKVSKK